MSNNNIKVLYIAGWGRSGSTILAKILGQIEGFFHGGELRTIWIDGLKPKGICGCGLPVKECPVWTSVFEKGFGGLGQINPQEITKLRLNSEPKTQEVLLANLLPGIKSRLKSRLDSYTKVLNNLYQAIQDTTGSRVIVDDSLHPGYAYTLSMMPNIDLYLVHIIRDARGCAYSWWKRRKTGLGRYTVRGSALGWNLRNITTEILASNLGKHKYLPVFYEGFIAQPKSTIEKIIDLVGESCSPLPFHSEEEVYLGITHSVFGNPNRTQTGVVRLKLDDQWNSQLTSSDKITVNCLSFPFLLRYGYFHQRK
jgi:hypothetical protein